MTPKELNEFIYKNDVTEVYHASLCASMKGLSTQAQVLWRLAEKLRVLHGLGESVRWREHARKEGKF